MTLNLTSSVDRLAGELPGPACLPHSAGVAGMLSTTSLLTWVLGIHTQMPHIRVNVPTKPNQPPTPILAVPFSFNYKAVSVNTLHVLYQSIFSQ